MNVREPTRDTVDPTKVSYRSRRVTTKVWTGEPVKIDSVTPVGRPVDFTKQLFEEAVDRVSRPLKGRLAHVPYSSDDLIREKREEAELEDRPS